MKERYSKIVLEACEGVSFAFSEGQAGQLIIKALKADEKSEDTKENINKKVAVFSQKNSEAVSHTNGANNIVSKKEEDHDTSSGADVMVVENYKKPPIPEGYKYVSGKWDNGFVIEKKAEGSEFVWVPVGALDSDGTIDGKNFCEKFGRRRISQISHANQKFTIDVNMYKEPLEGEFLEQYESVNKYGGFYISRYNISSDWKGFPRAIKSRMPWVNITAEDAKEVATRLEANSSTVKSHLVYGAEYDSVLAWLIKFKIKEKEDVMEDSTYWGNFWSNLESPQSITQTGSFEDWAAGGIYDLAGNVSEWTQEKNDEGKYIVRGANVYSGERKGTVSSRHELGNKRKDRETGFRIALWIK